MDTIPQDVLDALAEEMEAPEIGTKKPWHVDWKEIGPNEQQGRCEMNPEILFQKIYDPVLDLTKISYANGYGGWSLFACIREE